MDVKLVLSTKEYKELTEYCNLNDLLISSVVKESFTTGFNIERYGLLGDTSAPVEVVKEVPVEVIKEVVKIEYVDKEIIKEVPVEKIVEIIKEVPTPPVEVKVIEYVDRDVIKEVPVEKIVEKIVNIVDNSQVDELIGKTEQLKAENEIFSTKIEELKGQIQIFSTKTSEMENIFQNEKNELLLKIQQLEQREPQVVEKVVGDDSKQKLLEQTLQSLRIDIINKDKKIKEMEEIIQSFEKYKQNVGAVFLRGSNLDETLYK